MEVKKERKTKRKYYEKEIRKQRPGKGRGFHE